MMVCLGWAAYRGYGPHSYASGNGGARMKGEGDKAGATWALRLILMIRYATGPCSAETFRSKPVGFPRGPGGLKSQPRPVCTLPLPHGIEAPSVATVNNANREFDGVTSMTRRAPDPGNRESLGSGGSMVAKLKLKGIDGRAPPGVEPAA